MGHSLQSKTTRYVIIVALKNNKKVLCFIVFLALTTRQETRYYKSSSLEDRLTFEFLVTGNLHLPGAILPTTVLFHFLVSRTVSYGSS